MHMKDEKQCYAFTISVHPSIINYISADDNVLLKILAKTVGHRLLFIPDTQIHWNDFSIGTVKGAFKFKRKTKQNGSAHATPN